VEVKTGPRQWTLEYRVIWIAAHGTIPHGFVIHHRDNDCTNNDLSNLELKENGKHVSDHLRGVPKTPEHRAKISAALKSITRTPEHQANLTNALRGRKQSPEHIAKRLASRQRKKDEQ